MKPSLQAHRTYATLGQNGTLTLDNLPFAAGETVEVIVIPNNSTPLMQNPYPLRGTVFAYTQPFEPVAEQDWQAHS